MDCVILLPCLCYSWAGPIRYLSQACNPSLSIPMPPTPIRDGSRTITPYLSAYDAPRLVQFIAAAFGGVETFRKQRPDGALAHAEVRIGDSMLMLGEPTGEF